MSTIFISHSSRDSDFVDKLRQSLEAKGMYSLVDSRELRGRNIPIERIFKTLENARAFIVVVSPDAFNSAWVAEETRHASQVKEQCAEDFVIIPLLREGVELGALKWLFVQKPLAIRVINGAAGIKRALPQIISALSRSAGERPQQNLAPELQESSPESTALVEAIPAVPAEELLLEMRSPYTEKRGGKIYAAATAELSYISAKSRRIGVECREPYLFTAPIGYPEIEELKWYLDQYYLWPSGAEKQRAQEVEERLPQWGRELYLNVMPKYSCSEVLSSWLSAEEGQERRLTVFIDAQLVRGSSVVQQQEANRAAFLLLSLPWELLHDGERYLLQGAKSVRARRHLPLRIPRGMGDPSRSKSSTRVLLLSPQPDEPDSSALLPDEMPAQPVLEPLGPAQAFGEVTQVIPPTAENITAIMEKATDSGEDYAVIHVDGHRLHRQGAGGGESLFPGEIGSFSSGKADSDDPMAFRTEEFARTIRNHRPQLFFSRSLSIRQR